MQNGKLLRRVTPIWWKKCVGNATWAVLIVRMVKTLRKNYLPSRRWRITVFGYWSTCRAFWIKWSDMIVKNIFLKIKSRVCSDVNANWALYLHAKGFLLHNEDICWENLSSWMDLFWKFKMEGKFSFVNTFVQNLPLAVFANTSSWGWNWMRQNLSLDPAKN